MSGNSLRSFCVKIYTYGKHFVSLVKNEHFHRIRFEEATLDHVLNTSRRTNDDMRSIPESFHVISHTGASDTRMTFEVHEVADGNHNLLYLLGQFTSRGEDQCLTSLDGWIDFLKNGDGKGCGFSSS